MKETRLENLGSVCLIPYGSDNPHVNRVIRYIADNYHAVLDLTEAARAAGLSPSYLSRLFKSTLEQSFTAYCTAFRLNKAAWMLEHTTRSINAISYSCGFATTSYFIKVFREMTEKTPQKYREAFLEDIDNL